MLVEIISLHVDKFKSRNGAAVLEVLVLFNCSFFLINWIKHLFKYSLPIFNESTKYLETFNNNGLIFVRKGQHKLSFLTNKTRKKKQTYNKRGCGE